MAGVNLAVTLEAQPGENVTIECRYPTTAGSIIKHFCREEGNVTCTTQLSVFSVSQAKQGRFSIRDRGEPGAYTVTMSALSRNDSGRYRCVMEKSSEDTTRECLTQISLTVSCKHVSFSLTLTDKPASRSVEPTSSEPRRFGRYCNSSLLFSSRYLCSTHMQLRGTPSPGDPPTRVPTLPKVNPAPSMITLKICVCTARRVSTWNLLVQVNV